MSGRGNQKTGAVPEAAAGAAHSATHGATRLVTRADLMRSAGLLGGDYRFNDSAPADDQVLHGRFETLHLRPGLILHAAAVCDLQDMDTSNRLNPGVKIVVVIDGATDLSFGHHRFELGPQAADPAARDRGALVNLAEADLFSRRWRRGRHERKVSLTLTPEWLEASGAGDAGAPLLRSFLRSHLAQQSWTVSPHARELARQILAPASFLPGLQRLRLECRCIELATEALSQIGAGADEAPRAQPYEWTGAALAPDISRPVPAPPARLDGLRAADRRRLARLDELLHHRYASDAELSMAAIAREVGINPTSLQALTRRVWGETVFERLRTIRMARAHRLLVDGASVEQAAEVAGYAAAANFSTAFKRHYGITPRQARIAARRPT